MKHVRFLIAVCFVSVSILPMSYTHAQQSMYAKQYSGQEVLKTKKVIPAKRAIVKKKVEMDKRPTPHNPEPTPWTKTLDSSNAVPSLSVSITSPAQVQQNPYLTNFVRTSPGTIVALPLFAAIQTEEDIATFLHSVEEYPARLLERLPSVKTVYPTGSKPMKVINLACPVEVVTGEHFSIFDALRSAGNKVFEGINSTNALPNDLMLVCS